MATVTNISYAGIQGGEKILGYNDHMQSSKINTEQFRKSKNHDNGVILCLEISRLEKSLLVCQKSTYCLSQNCLLFVINPISDKSITNEKRSPLIAAILLAQP